MNAPLEIRKGLEGVIVDTTSTSLVDGQAGKLYYRGYEIAALARRRFADVAHLVVFGELPDAARAREFERFLREAGRLPAGLEALAAHAARLHAHPMAALQAVAALLAVDPPGERMGRSDAEQQGLVVAARLPAAIAVIHAARQGRTMPGYPDRERYGERFLALVTGATPDARAVAAFECTQVLQLEHNLNASTFTARVVTSTLAEPAAALSAAMAALSGPLHGAADEMALQMAEEVGEPARAAAFVRECLASHRKVMGMGHREYRVRDPRAYVVHALAGELAAAGEHRRLLAILEAVEAAFVEQTSERGRALHANVDFYKGIVYLALGIPKELFTASFAAARAFGWLAHLVEQRADNRIIRPEAHYVGPAPRAA